MSYTREKIGDDTFDQIFHEIRCAYDDSPTNELAAQIANLLSKNCDFTGPEYRLMCWLKFHGVHSDPRVVLPTVLEKNDIPNIELTVFQTDFAWNYQRSTLFENLKSTVSNLRAARKLEMPIQILVGGSYIDQKNDHPNDIDCIFLIPEENWVLNPVNYMEPVLRLIPILNTKSVDYKTLPDNFSLDRFKAYNDISLLANNAKNRDKGDRMITNEFTPRKVVSFSL